MWLECGFVGDLFFFSSVFDSERDRQNGRCCASSEARSANFNLPHQAFSETVYFIDYSSVQHWIPSILKQLGEWVSDSNFSAHTPLKCEVESFSLFSTGTKLNHLRCQRCVLLPVTQRSLSFPCARFSVSSSVFMVIILVLALWLVAPSPVCHSDVSPLLHFFTPLVRQL